MGDGWKRAIKAAQDSRRVARQHRIERMALREGSRVVWKGQAAVVRTISKLGMVTIAIGKSNRKVDPNSLGILAG
jgi:hypothetical protein